MIRDEIETVETTAPILLKEQAEQLKRNFPQVSGNGELILIPLKSKLNNALGK